MMESANESLFVHAIPEWLELVSLACCIGALVCLLWVVPPRRGDAASDRETLLTGIRRLLGFAVLALLASTSAGLLVRSAEMSGYPVTAASRVLPTVVLRTHVGHAWILRIAAIVALSLTTIAARRSRRSVPLLYGMLGCAIVVSAMGSASGHASDAGDFGIPEMMDWLHLLAAMAWGGGLLVLSALVLPTLVEQGDRAASSLASVAARFSRIAGIAAAFIVLTAPYQEWAHGGSVEGLARSPYGRTVVAKIALFSGLLFLGAFNRYVNVPRLEEWAGSATAARSVLGRVAASVLSPLGRGTRGPLVAARFKRTVRLEAVLVLGVLFCAALLRHEVPARHAAHSMASSTRRPRGVVAATGGTFTGPAGATRGADRRGRPSRPGGHPRP